MTPPETQDTDWFGADAATFGDRVTAAREALGFSERDLAERLGINQRTLRNWETDTAEPRANKLQMLAGMLNVSMRWLLTGEGQGIAAPEPAGSGADLSALLAEIRRLRGEAKRTADRLGLLEDQLEAALSETI